MKKSENVTTKQNQDNNEVILEINDCLPNWLGNPFTLSDNLSTLQLSFCKHQKQTKERLELHFSKTRTECARISASVQDKAESIAQIKKI